MPTANGGEFVQRKVCLLRPRQGDGDGEVGDAELVAQQETTLRHVLVQHRSRRL